VETSSLAGFGDQARVCEELVEWDYGEYEGLTDDDSDSREPGWDLFIDGAPDRESPQAVTDRVDRVLANVNSLDGPILLVGHGKLLRALAARWLGFGSVLPMDPAAISVLARQSSRPLLQLWNLTDLHAIPQPHEVSQR
jgi:broad specificity phosphatase PhoE